MAATPCWMPSPSVNIGLLRVFLKPQAQARAQAASVTAVATFRLGSIRHSTNWTPRERFAQTKRLDKLHRKQKINNRIERQESEKRAHTVIPLSFPSTSTSSSSSPSTSETENQAETQTQTQPQTQNQVAPYFIHRTKSRNIPVYETTKAGGSKHITTLRKCAGDLDVLKQDILDALKLEPSFVDPKGQKKHNVVVNKLTNQLVIRGWRGAEVKEWCRLAGF